MSLIQILSVSGCLLFLGVILFSVYRGKIQEAYALIWIVTGLFILAVSFSSRFLHFLSRCVGIQTPAFAILLLLLFGILLLLFQLTVVISKSQERIRRLGEEVALLKARVMVRSKKDE